MVIGNGFFSDTLSDAIKEMQRISKCEVVQCAFPTIGNIVYYISYNGDIFEIQMGENLLKAEVLIVTEHATKNDAGLMYKII